MPLLWTHGLEAGDPLGGPLFPQVLPAPIASEGEVRTRGPEAPDPEHVKATIAAMQKTMRERASAAGTRP